MTRPQLFVIRGPDGHPEAIHQRDQDKKFTWWSAGPDGGRVPGLQGRRVATLPLFGSQHAAKWDTSRRVFLVEGERDTLALANAGHRALGTVGGAGVTPSSASLAVLIGLHVVAWADNDAAGKTHMQAIARVIQAGVASLRWVDWPDAPAGGGASDYLAAGLRIEHLKLVPVSLPEPVDIEQRRRETVTTS